MAAATIHTIFERSDIRRAARLWSSINFFLVRGACCQPVK